MGVNPRARVLVVDDQSFNRVILGRMLSKLGLEVVEAENGQVALELFLAAVHDSSAPTAAAAPPPPAQPRSQTPPAPQPVAEATAAVRAEAEEQQLDAAEQEQHQLAAGRQLLRSQLEDEGGWPESEDYEAAASNPCFGDCCCSACIADGRVDGCGPPAGPSGAAPSTVLAARSESNPQLLRPAQLPGSSSESHQEQPPAPVSFILLDLQMPVLNGWRFAAQLRQLERNAQWKRVPIVACTALTGDAAATALAYGVDELMEKPPSITKLQRVLARHNVWGSGPLRRTSEPDGGTCAGCAAGKRRSLLQDAQ